MTLRQRPDDVEGEEDQPEFQGGRQAKRGFQAFDRLVVPAGQARANPQP